MSETFRASRTATVTVALTMGLLAVTGCRDAGGGDGDVQLSMTWWGSDARHQNTEELIEIYEEQNPEVAIDAEYRDWDGYWDSLATQAAGRNLPDIIQMDGLYIREYAENGMLLDLADMDHDQLHEGVRDGGATDEGVWGMSYGLTVMALAANRDIFSEAGIEVPDDTSWDWDDLDEISAEISESTGAYGLTALNESAGLELWLRQHGKDMITEDGERGLPANPDSLELIRDDLNEQEAEIADFADEVGEELGESTPIPPEGTSSFPDYIYRYTQEVLFERETPEEAAENMYAEMESSIS